jgi:predicted nucleic acid-binding protein
MRINQALLGVSRLFLDTAPVVYFVEENPYFLPLVSPIFTQIENGFLIGVASPVTLAECLVMPYRMSDLILQQKFIDLLNNTENIDFFGSDRQVGQKSGELRAKYNLQLPDALQIATAIASNCQAFLTNDGQLQRVTEVRVLLVSELEI